MQAHKIVSDPEWLAARRDLLVQEKALSKARDLSGCVRRHDEYQR